MNIGVYNFFRIGVSGFLRYIPSSGIARLKDSSIFKFLRKFHTVFKGTSYMGEHICLAHIGHMTQHQEDKQSN